MENIKSAVFVKIDDQSRIVRCDGGYTTPTDLTGWIKIDEGVGDRYNLCQSHYFDEGLYADGGIPRYKLVDGKPVERTADELKIDRDSMPTPQPNEEDKLKTLESKHAALSESHKFLEECLVEMASVVYA